jgi:murein L,D-transpeptidase YcbB/YkuD
MPHLPDEVIRDKGWGDEDVNREIGRGVQRTVDVIREMVRNGEIQ